MNNFDLFFGSFDNTAAVLAASSTVLLWSSTIQKVSKKIFFFFDFHEINTTQPSRTIVGRWGVGWVPFLGGINIFRVVLSGAQNFLRDHKSWKDRKYIYGPKKGPSRRPSFLPVAGTPSTQEQMLIQNDTFYFKIKHKFCQADQQSNMKMKNTKSYQWYLPDTTH